MILVVTASGADPKAMLQAAIDALETVETFPSHPSDFRVAQPEVSVTVAVAADEDAPPLLDPRPVAANGAKLYADPATGEVAWSAAPLPGWRACWFAGAP